MEESWLKEHYPNLHHLLEEMAFDNDMHFKEEIELDLGEASFWALEDMASRLVGEEAAIMAAGERSEVEALIRAKDLGELDQFLAEVFDGELHELVWK